MHAQKRELLQFVRFGSIHFAVSYRAISLAGPCIVLYVFKQNNLRGHWMLFCLLSCPIFLIVSILLFVPVSSVDKYDDLNHAQVLQSSPKHLMTARWSKSTMCQNAWPRIIDAHFCRSWGRLITDN